MQENYSLLKHNTFGINISTRWFIDYTSREELRAALAFYNTLPQGTPLLHIGGGSNLLFLSDFDGVVLHCSNKEIVTVEENDTSVVLRVGAGVVWDDLVAYTIDHDLHGLENLSLIPGEVGASAVQNIGAYGAEAKDFIHEVECVNLHTGETRIFSNEECDYSYRHSIFKTEEHRNQWAVVSVTYTLLRTFSPNLDYGGIRNELERRGIDAQQLTASQLRQVIIDIRKYKLPDPKVLGNAVSFFMNPIVSREKYESLAAIYPSMPHYIIDEDHVKIPAGWMIEQCGWKGKGIGRAAVHDRQALVLVNKGGATSTEIVNLCDTVRADVSFRFGIDIRPEVIFI